MYKCATQPVLIVAAKAGYKKKPSLKDGFYEKGFETF
jgi:hypothetical protein